MNFPRIFEETFSRLTEKKCSLKIIETNFPGTKKLQEQDRRQIQILIKSSLHLMLYLCLSYLILVSWHFRSSPPSGHLPNKELYSHISNFSSFLFLSPILHSKFTQGTLFSLDCVGMELSDLTRLL